MDIKIEKFDKIDSTNSQIERAAAAGASEGYVASADEQTSGRGRSGHEWESPEGVSVSTSILLYPKDVPPERIPRLTIIAAMAVAQAIEELYPLETAIKWPNDILVFEEKICGILTERHPELEQAEKGVPVIVGIGVNVHHSSFPGELSDKAISVDMALDELRKMSPEKIPGDIRSHRGEICEMIWSKFAVLYEDFIREKGSLGGILDDYNSRLINRDRTVRVLDPAGEYEAVARGIDEEGRLVIESETGLKKIDSGEVSVRGIYGYV